MFQVNYGQKAGRRNNHLFNKLIQGITLTVIVGKFKSGAYPLP